LAEKNKFRKGSNRHFLKVRQPVDLGKTRVLHIKGILSSQLRDTGILRKRGTPSLVFKNLSKEVLNWIIKKN